MKLQLWNPRLFGSDAGPFKAWFHNTMKFQPQDEFFLQQEGHGTRSFSGFA